MRLDQPMSHIDSAGDEHMSPSDSGGDTCMPSIDASGDAKGVDHSGALI